MQALDSEQVYETPFEDKFVPRRCSNDLLIGVLRAVLVAQQKPDPATVAHVEGAGRRSGSGPPQRKRRRTARFNDGYGEGEEGGEDPVPQPRPAPVVDQEVKKASLDPAAGSIFAGLTLGSAA